MSATPMSASDLAAVLGRLTGGDGRPVRPTDPDGGDGAGGGAAAPATDMGDGSSVGPRRTRRPEEEELVPLGWVRFPGRGDDREGWAPRVESGDAPVVGSRRGADDLGEDGPAVDWGLVVVLRRRASERISRAKADHRERHGRDLDEEDVRVLGASVIRSVVAEHAETLADSGAALWTRRTEARHVKALTDAIFGYGRLQPLLSLAEAENIEICGSAPVLVQFGDGHREQFPPVADTDAELVEAVRFLGESARPPRPFDDAHPTMTVALGDRFRLHAIGFGLAHRPSVVIRHHRLTDVTLDDLAACGMMPQRLASLLRAAVLARRSIVISGDQGAGKTTLLRALVAAIPETERFATLETDYELLTHLAERPRNMVALQASVGWGESVDGRALGEFSVADLVPEALRQNLARLVVGEVRGAEAGAMFEAMQAGAGTMSTTHSHSASATMDRLAARVARGGVITMEEAYRQIAHNIGLLVHVDLVDDTWRGGTRRRFVREVRELTGAIESGRPVTHLTYRALHGGREDVFDPSAALLDDLVLVDPTLGAAL